MFAYLITLISFILKPEKRKLIILSYKLKSKIGLEIGGPSAMFRLKGHFPVYLFAKRIDGVNFSTETVWEGKISEGRNYNYFKNKKGYQYIQEASELTNLPEAYDFLLSCHSLEHIANPIKALKNWHRLLKPGGELILILPDKRNTFDILRPYTTMEHLINDFKQNVTEYDTTHFDEILSNYSAEKNEGYSREKVGEVLKENYTLRQAHHHVFNFETISEMLLFCGFKPTYQQAASPFHLITIATRV